MPIRSAAAVRLDKEARASQIDQLRRLRAERSPWSRVSIMEIMESFPQEKLDGHVELTLTGIHLIDADAAHRELLAQALPDHDILEDQPLPLIEPMDLQAELLGAVEKLPGVPAARQGEGLAQLSAGMRRP